MMIFMCVLILILKDAKGFCYEKYEGHQCTGISGDIERDFVGTAAECRERCSELGDDCYGFVRVNSGSTEHEGKCYFRGGGLNDPISYSGDDRDCYAKCQGSCFDSFVGYQCEGSSDDILRDFVGDAEECKDKCVELGDECKGFVRVNSGNSGGDNEECFFRGGELLDPYPQTSDNRDCYKRCETCYEKFEGQQCTGSDYDILRDFVGTADECKLKCKQLGNCAGFVRVNSGNTEINGKCFFRGGQLNEPQTHTIDNRDCYKPCDYEPCYERFEGEQCEGSIDDVLRDFVGTADECKLKCDELGDCVGFIRVNSGSLDNYNGQCFFRGKQLNDPYPYTGDNRDCYKPC